MKTSTILLFLATAFVRAQTGSDILKQLQSPNWQDRHNAYSAITNKPALTPEEESALVALLSRENEVTEQAYREGSGASGKYGEDYSEYTGWLAETVMKIADREPNRSDVWIPLLNSGYFPDSPFGKWLASHGDRTADLLMAQTESHSEAYRRGDALIVLAEMATYERDASTSHRLNSRALSRIEQVVRQGIDDKEAVVRTRAVGAIALLGTTDDLATLQRIALTDPQLIADGGPSGSEVRFPVRLAASRASERLQKRLDADRKRGLGMPK